MTGKKNKYLVLQVKDKLIFTKYAIYGQLTYDFKNLLKLGSRFESKGIQDGKKLFDFIPVQSPPGSL